MTDPTPPASLGGMGIENRRWVGRGGADDHDDDGVWWAVMILTALALALALAIPLPDQP